MVYALAMKKTAGFMVVAMILSLSIVFFLSSSPGSPTGQVTGSGALQSATGIWMILMVGIFVGLLMLAVYLYIGHTEEGKE